MMMLRVVPFIQTILTTLMASLLCGNTAFCAENLSDHLTQLFKENDIIFLGEWHGINGHRQAGLHAIDQLVKSNSVQAIAVEFIDETQNQLFQDFVKDEQATPGSIREREYLLCFSDSSRSKVKLGSCKPGGWISVLSEPSIQMFRFLKYLSQSNRIDVCGIDHDDSYGENRNSIKAKFAKLPLEVQKYGISHMVTASDPLGAWAVRELSIASNVMACAEGGKKVLALVGGYHAAKLNKNSAVSIVTRLRPQISISSGFLISPPPIEQKEEFAKSDVGIAQLFEVARATNSPDFFVLKKDELMKLDSRLDVLLVQSFDFFVTGPTTKTNGQ